MFEGTQAGEQLSRLLKSRGTAATVCGRREAGDHDVDPGFIAGDRQVRLPPDVSTISYLSIFALYFGEHLNSHDPSAAGIRRLKQIAPLSSLAVHLSRAEGGGAVTASAKVRRCVVPRLLQINVCLSGFHAAVI